MMNSFDIWRGSEPDGFVATPNCGDSKGLETRTAHSTQVARDDNYLRVVATHFIDSQWVMIAAAEVPDPVEEAC